MAGHPQASGRRVYVVDGARTPFLKAKTGLGPFTGSDLAVAAGKPLLLRQPFEATAFDEVIVGAAMPSADEANIARVLLRIQREEVEGGALGRHFLAGVLRGALRRQRRARRQRRRRRRHRSNGKVGSHDRLGEAAGCKPEEAEQAQHDDESPAPTPASVPGHGAIVSTTLARRAISVRGPRLVLRRPSVLRA